MKEKELIWVSKEFAEKYKVLENDTSKRDEQEKMFNEYLESVKESVRCDFKANLESIEEEAAIFTGLLLKTRQAFEKAKNEHCEASYALWEGFDKERGSIKEKTTKLITELKPLKDELIEINELMGKIKTYEMDRVIETIDKLNGLYGNSKAMIKFLVNNFKPTQEVK